ncbi:hypothetical protein [Ulvibacterium sp.]|uniref:hypothetical protein n=1 Tax=Ulvibacterium sp. TaxID=2665914 RepID=UPI002606F61D|nr:hypothetical protein [Ulvibacterium sp.]
MKISAVWVLSALSLLLLGCSNSSDDDGPDTQPPIDRSGNLLPTGASANDILSNDDFTKLKIEIAYVTGFRPTPRAIENFVNFLRLRTFKQDIELVYTQLPSPDEETLTLQEVAQLESDNRTAYNEGDTLAIYIYFADAPADDDDEEEGLVTLGAVYRNTSMIIHQGTVWSLAAQSIFITITDVETATLEHEFGHLFGLVDLGTDPINNHEDPDAPNHCNVEGCLMRAELQFGSPSFKRALAGKSGEIKSACSLSGASILKLLDTRAANGSLIVPNLDPECILDLQSNGGR